MLYLLREEDYTTPTNNLITPKIPILDIIYTFLKALPFSLKRCKLYIERGTADRRLASEVRY